MSEILLQADARRARGWTGGAERDHGRDLVIYTTAGFCNALRSRSAVGGMSHVA